MEILMYTKHPHTGERLLLPGLKLIGAKNKTRGLLYEYFPSQDLYSEYVEPFMGTAGVLIGKRIDPIENTGDLNRYAINYYKTLQDSPEDFYNLMISEWKNLKSIGKPYFNSLKQNVTRTSDLVEQSVNFYLITKHCMNGIWRLNKAGECNSSYCGTTDGRGIFSREHFEKVVERIENVNFTYGDYSVLLDQVQDNKEAFVFLDPPYLLKSQEVPDGCVTTYNGCKFTLTDHLALHDSLSNGKYKFLLTINDCAYIRNLYKDFNLFSFDVFYSCSQTPGGRGKKGELIITNYDPTPTTYNLVKV